MAMPNPPDRSVKGVPARFAVALGVATAFVAFLTIDQSHWWRLKPDYAFGWLVPALVLFIIVDRWQRIRATLNPTAPSPLPRWLKTLASVVAGLALGLGLLIFILGALYRASEGASQPGSIALAAGFSGILLGMIYFPNSTGRSRRRQCQSRAVAPSFRRANPCDSALSFSRLDLDVVGAPRDRPREFIEPFPSSMGGNGCLVRVRRPKPSNSSAGKRARSSPWSSGSGRGLFRHPFAHGLPFCGVLFGGRFFKKVLAKSPPRSCSAGPCLRHKPAAEPVLDGLGLCLRKRCDRRTASRYNRLCRAGPYLRGVILHVATFSGVELA